MGTLARVLAISDLHCPFQHADAFNFLEKTAEKWKCNKIVCIGDEMDFHALSRFPIDPDGYSPKQEYEFGVQELKKLYKIFPEVKVCISNHTSRPYRKGYMAGIPSAFLKNYRDLLHAPQGWNWHEDGKIIIDGVLYIHGDSFSGQSAHIRAATLNRKSVVHGHMHSHGGIQYLKGLVEKKIFGMNIGCLINENEYAFKYAMRMPYRPTLGCGVIVDGEEAYFISMKEK